MLIKEAKEIVSISNRNSKMPGSTFAQDSFACKVGSKLAVIKGSVCHKCYARRIQRMRPSVNKGWTSNYEKSTNLIKVNPSKWIEACVTQISKMAKNSGEKYHRWFDSGDLDSVEQLDAIIQVAKQTPDISHWLPTREIGMVKSYTGDIPENMVIRVSSPMVGQKPVKGFNNTSTVHEITGPEGWTPYLTAVSQHDNYNKIDSQTVLEHGYSCPARKQGNACLNCRACWDKSVPNVSYEVH